ncbi:ABC transporter [Elizabethkingia miricola]|nr:ABC transporter [Elizabethkingia miricola]NHQ70216.1 ABC transporter [Elizabethkingia miricola]NHQ76387.1 ABC transporter [Elizabethkingia miricola]PSL87829.1 ABC transporter [Elizabethkingia miricola]QHQ86256.1 ABC transporter [Elizabethkingia miricola]
MPDFNNICNYPPLPDEKWRKEAITERRLLRKFRFGSIDRIPEKAIFRKTNIQIWFILILAVIVVPAIIMMEKNNQKYVLSIRLFMAAVFVIGALIKLILGYIFPELTLSDKGVKVFGRELIAWNDIKRIKTVGLYAGDAQLIIVKKNNKKITEDFKRLNTSSYKLALIVRSFAKKYKTRDLLLSLNNIKQPV